MTEQYANRSHPEHVVLEIGEDVGAIVVYTPAELHGTEIEISASGNDRDRAHKDVLNRPINSRPTYAAVFDKIQEGSYTLWIGGAPVARDVVVAGANITELDWRGLPAPAVHRSMALHAH
jgi:hypothetical protein